MRGRHCSTRLLHNLTPLLQLATRQGTHLPLLPAPNRSYMRATAAGGKRNLVVDVMLRTLGLDICADTLVRAFVPAGWLAGWLAGWPACLVVGRQVIVASIAKLPLQLGMPINHAAWHARILCFGACHATHLSRWATT